MLATILRLPYEKCLGKICSNITDCCIFQVCDNSGNSSTCACKGGYVPASDHDDDEEAVECVYDMTWVQALGTFALICGLVLLIPFIIWLIKKYQQRFVAPKFKDRQIPHSDDTSASNPNTVISANVPEPGAAAVAQSTPSSREQQPKDISYGCGEFQRR